MSVHYLNVYTNRKSKIAVVISHARIIGTVDLSIVMESGHWWDLGWVKYNFLVSSSFT